MTKYTKHILILGSGRSGTSWLCEIIAQQHRYRLLFEPEHEFNTLKGKLICDKHLHTNNISEEAIKYLKHVFLNRVDNDWIAQSSNRRFKRHLWPFIPKKFVIKMVRANLMGEYIYNVMNMPTIKIIRNPYEVLKSQLRVNFSWLSDLNHFQKQEELTDLLQEKFNFSFDQKEFNHLEKLVIRWCIENCSITTIVPNGVIPFKYIKYEDLIGNVAYFKEICTYFNLKPLENIDDIYGKPSSKTHPKSKIRNIESKQKQFSSEEYKMINELLDQFEIIEYSRKS